MRSVNSHAVTITQKDFSFWLMIRVS